MISNVAWAARSVCIIQRRIFAAKGGHGAGTHPHRGLRWCIDGKFGAVADDSRVNTCEIVQGPPLQLRTPGCTAEPLAKLSPSGLRKFSDACMNPEALKDDSPMDEEEAFVFGAFRLLPAQRMLLE